VQRYFGEFRPRLLYSVI